MGGKSHFTQFSLLFYSFFLLATLSLKNSLFSHSVLCDNNYDSKCARQKRGRKICLTSTCWNVFCGEESQAIKGNVQRCYRWRWKAKWMVNHRAWVLSREHVCTRENGPWTLKAESSALLMEASGCGSMRMCR